MKRILLIAAIVLLSAGALHAQEASPIIYPQNSITVGGFGSAYGEPDVAYLELGVEIVDADLAEAFSQAATSMDAVIQALHNLGIAETDIQTTGVNVYPEDRFNPQDPNAQTERVYRVRNTVRVTVRDVEQTEAVISAAVSAGANTIYNLTFGIEDPQGLEQEARTLAVADAQNRAQQLAAALGVTLGQPSIISETLSGGGIPPQPFGFGGAVMRDVAQPVSTGQLSVSVQVQITFTIAGE